MNEISCGCDVGYVRIKRKNGENLLMKTFFLALPESGLLRGVEFRRDETGNETLMILRFAGSR
jgi:hypothetical protein